jgi:hypothetical protein
VWRKSIYEELYPETKHGGDKPSRQIGDFEKGNKPNRFSSSTASATGKSERVIQRAAARGEKREKI